MFRQINNDSQAKVATAVQEDRILPYRTMSDFLTDARWNIPDFSNVERLNNRIINNLIYYQTNYIFYTTLYTIPIIFFNLNDIFASFGYLLLFVFLYNLVKVSWKKYNSNPFYARSNGQRNALIILYVIIGYGFLHAGFRCLYSILISSLSILVPIVAVLIHATLRKRNTANKITNQIEKVKLDRTPMGRLLAKFGFIN